MGGRGSDFRWLVPQALANFTGTFVSQQPLLQQGQAYAKIRRYGIYDATTVDEWSENNKDNSLSLCNDNSNRRSAIPSTGSLPCVRFPAKRSHVLFQNSAELFWMTFKRRSAKNPRSTGNSTNIPACSLGSNCSSRGLRWGEAAVLRMQFHEVGFRCENVIANPPFEIGDCVSFLQWLSRTQRSGDRAVLLLPYGFIDKPRPKSVQETMRHFIVCHRTPMQEPFARTACGLSPRQR